MTRVCLLSLTESAQMEEETARRLFPRRYERAMRYRQREDQLRCIGAGLLIAGILGVSEERLRTDPRGKPFLPEGPCFSVSHSGEYSLLAVGDRPLGADIEAMDERHLSLVRRVLTPEEQAFQAEDPLNRFFLLWTMKESLLKATGQGIAADLRQLSVLPLLRGQGLRHDGRLFYGASCRMPGYAVSLCEEDTPVAPLTPVRVTLRDLRLSSLWRE